MSDMLSVLSTNNSICSFRVLCCGKETISLLMSQARLNLSTLAWLATRCVFSSSPFCLFRSGRAKEHVASSLPLFCWIVASNCYRLWFVAPDNSHWSTPRTFISLCLKAKVLDQSPS